MSSNPFALIQKALMIMIKTSKNHSKYLNKLQNWSNIDYFSNILTIKNLRLINYLDIYYEFRSV